VDDGYAETLMLLRQEIERAEVPVTLFIVSDYVGGAQEYWWDALEWLLDDGTGAEAACQPTWRGWEAPVTAPQRAYTQAVAAMRATGAKDQRRVLGSLPGTNTPATARTSRRVVNRHELKDLASCALIDVGSHTRTHPVLSSLTLEQQQDELAGAHQRLSEMIEGSLASLAYPFGQQSDYNAGSLAIAAGLDVSCACSNVTGVVTRSTPRLDLPRWQVNDCDGDEFERQVRLLMG
jgi:peptidoglycan/xylan/chitin deacetylase (PgdA/CDA1 family)